MRYYTSTITRRWRRGKNVNLSLTTPLRRQITTSRWKLMMHRHSRGSAWKNIRRLNQDSRNHSNVKREERGGIRKIRRSLILFVYASKWKIQRADRSRQQKNSLIVSIRIFPLDVEVHFLNDKLQEKSLESLTNEQKVRESLFANSKAIKLRFPFCWFASQAPHRTFFLVPSSFFLPQGACRRFGVK